MAAYAFLANIAVIDLRFWIGTGLITVLAALGIWFTIRDTMKAHDRLAEIELYINDRVGEDILVWENL